MAKRRLNKEIKLDICDDIDLKYGTINKDNPKVIYVSGKCWITPMDEMDYPCAVSSIEKEFLRVVKDLMFDGDDFDDKIIMDFDVNGENMELGEKKFLSFDFFLRQGNGNNKSLRDLKSVVSNKVMVAINSLLCSLNEKNFSVSKTKRQPK